MPTLARSHTTAEVRDVLEVGQGLTKDRPVDGLFDLACHSLHGDIAKIASNQLPVEADVEVIPTKDCHKEATFPENNSQLDKHEASIEKLDRYIPKRKKLQESIFCVTNNLTHELSLLERSNRLERGLTDVETRIEGEFPMLQRHEADRAFRGYLERS